MLFFCQIILPFPINNIAFLPFYTVVYTRWRLFPTFLLEIFFTVFTCINIKIPFFIHRFFSALIPFKPPLLSTIFYETLLVCIKLKHAEDVTSDPVYSSLLKLRTRVRIVKPTAKILDFSFLEWDCNETEANFCKFFGDVLMDNINNGAIIATVNK